MKSRFFVVILILTLVLSGCSGKKIEQNFQPVYLEIDGDVQGYVSAEYAKKLWDEAICTAAFLERQSMTGAYTLCFSEAPSASRKEYTFFVSSDLNLVKYNDECYRLTESGKTCLRYLIEVSDWISKKAEPFLWKADTAVKIIASYGDFAIGVLDDQPDIRVKIKSSGELSAIVGKTIVLTNFYDAKKEGERIEIISNAFITPEELKQNIEANQTEE